MFLLKCHKLLKSTRDTLVHPVHGKYLPRLAGAFFLVFGWNCQWVQTELICPHLPTLLTDPYYASSYTTAMCYDKSGLLKSTYVHYPLITAEMVQNDPTQYLLNYTAQHAENYYASKLPADYPSQGLDIWVADYLVNPHYTLTLWSWCNGLLSYFVSSQLWRGVLMWFDEAHEAKGMKSLHLHTSWIAKLSSHPVWIWLFLPIL